jgi:hypothetical protein
MNPNLKENEDSCDEEEELVEDGETYFNCTGTCNRVMHYEDTNGEGMCGRCQHEESNKSSHEEEEDLDDEEEDLDEEDEEEEEV